jgi:NADPH:quinone reductase-like Zn-dependent oxidoreductase
MREIVITKHGPPDVFRMRERPDPIPDSDQVRIAVAAAGVNFADVLARLGLYPDAPAPPIVVGYEVAGMVDAVGSSVTSFRPGDRVVALTRFGGYATAAVVPERFVFPIPSGLSDVEAAGVPVNYLTAIVALYRLANLDSGETVLISGAGGGVGVAATQLAKARGAVVVGTASPSKLEAIRALGVDYAIDRHLNIEAEVRRITGGRGVDVALDSVGGKHFAASYRLLAPLGRLVLCGASTIASGERRSLWRVAQTLIGMPAFRPLSLMNHNRAVAGLNLGHLWDETARLRRSMDQIAEGLEAGRLRPAIARTFALDEAADAHRYLQSRANIGKVVLVTESVNRAPAAAVP